MHWNGISVEFSPGVGRAHAPASDTIEPLWITYYSTIFNPTRPKPRAMQTQLPKRNWQNLPEAIVIDSLLRSAGRSATETLERSAEVQSAKDDYSLAQPPADASLQELREA